MNLISEFPLAPVVSSSYPRTCLFKAQSNPREQTQVARVGIVVGLLLCGLTFVAMVGTPVKSPTLFIPMMLGIPVLFCGVVALNPHRRKHAMHAAAAIGLLGAAAGAVRAMYCLFELAGGSEIDRYGLKIIVGMSVICTIFVVICVVSFVQMRRRKTTADEERSVSSINMPETIVEDDRNPDAESRESA